MSAIIVEDADHEAIRDIVQFLVDRTCKIIEISSAPTRRKVCSEPAVLRSFSVPGSRPNRSPISTKMFLPLKELPVEQIMALGHRSSSSTESNASISRHASPKRFAAEIRPISFWQYISLQFNSSNTVILPVSISNMSRFARIPFRLERFLLIGFLVCLEDFLYIFTLLPLRLVLGFLWPATKWSPKDLVRAILIISCCVLLYLLNVTFSTIYHLIRGQNFFKLYVLFNILTVFDKLCCSFGEDILDALYANADARLLSRYTLLDLLVASGYAIVHTLVLYLQVVCLNVAMNSNTSALVSLLSSNNFLELKSSVFKKYSKAQVFQIATSDIVERFHLVLFAVVILVVNLSNIGGVDAASDWFEQASQRFVILIIMEMLVDWVKHGCIIKFNSLHADLFDEFRDVLYSDLGSGRALGAVPDALHFISRRIGFVSIPIAVVLMRGVMYSLWAAMSSVRNDTGFIIAVGFLSWAILISVKLGLRLILLGIAADTALAMPRHVDSYRSVERYSVFMGPPSEPKLFHPK